MASWGMRARAVLLAALALPPPTRVLAADVPAAAAPILPETLRWVSPPGNTAVHGAWVLGGEHEAGPYLFRVRLERGARISPHVHPDTRSTTVLSGTLWVGFGETVDDARLVAVPAGAVYMVPAGVSHWLAAKDGEVVYQESGAGPTETKPLAR